MLLAAESDSTAYNLGYYGTFVIMAALVILIIVWAIRKGQKSSTAGPGYPPPPQQQGPPPGWYPDPQNPQGQRYWNGQSWQ